MRFLSMRPDFLQSHLNRLNNANNLFSPYYGILNIYLSVQIYQNNIFNYSIFLAPGVHVVNENLILPSQSLFTYTNAFCFK